jgi:hypothetical protein
MTDLRLLDLVYRAEACGDMEPLACHIEGGGEITREMRVLLAAYLRGKKKRQGRPRTYDQRTKESRILSVYRVLRDLGYSHDKALEHLPNDVNIDTARSILSRVRRRGGVWRP